MLAHPLNKNGWFGLMIDVFIYVFHLPSQFQIPRKIFGGVDTVSYFSNRRTVAQQNGFGALRPHWLHCTGPSQGLSVSGSRASWTFVGKVSQKRDAALHTVDGSEIRLTS